MKILGIVLANLAHSVVTMLIIIILVKYMYKKLNLSHNISFGIILATMVGHWFLFNGCFLVYIVDKPIAHLFGATEYLEHHNFSDTVIYKLFDKYF